MKTAPRPRFRYSAYWGKWSLQLTDRWAVRSAGGHKPGSFSTVEIDLQPINGWGFTDGSDEVVRSMNLRVHMTSPHKNDKLEHELPIHVEIELMAQLGPDLTAWLLDPASEILGLVDWDLYRQRNNGGASLREIAHPRFAQIIPETRPSGMMARLAQHAKAA